MLSLSMASRWFMSCALGGRCQECSQRELRARLLEALEFDQPRFDANDLLGMLHRARVGVQRGAAPAALLHQGWKDGEARPDIEQPGRWSTHDHALREFGNAFHAMIIVGVILRQGHDAL